MKQFLLIVFTIIAADLFAQDYVVTNDGAKLPAAIETFDIYTLNIKNQGKDKIKKARIIKDTSALQAFHAGGIDFVLTNIYNLGNVTHAFLPLDSSLQNIKTGTSQFVLSKYNYKDKVVYDIYLGANGVSGSTGLSGGISGGALGGILGAAAGTIYDKKKHLRPVGQYLILIKDEHGQLLNLFDSYDLKRNCWSLLRQYFSDNTVIVSEIDDYLKEKKKPSYQKIKKMILAYMGNPKLEKVKLVNPNYRENTI